MHAHCSPSRPRPRRSRAPVAAAAPHAAGALRVVWWVDGGRGRAGARLGTHARTRSLRTGCVGHLQQRGVLPPPQAASMRARSSAPCVLSSFRCASRRRRLCVLSFTLRACVRVGGEHEHAGCKGSPTQRIALHACGGAQRWGTQHARAHARTHARTHALELKVLDLRLVVALEPILLAGDAHGGRCGRGGLLRQGPARALPACPPALWRIGLHLHSINELN